MRIGFRPWMTRARRGLLVGGAVVLLAVLAACGTDGTGAEAGDLTFDVGTEEDRAALFDYLVEKTLERDAFASLPDHPYHRAHPKGIDVVALMEEHRDELIAADTDKKMWFALRKISNARKDRHLGLGLVDGGLELPEELDVRRMAPIHFAVDYGDPEARFFFVADRGTRIGELVDGPVPELGDRLVQVEGRTAEEHVGAIRPYKRYSQDHAFWWLVADEISRTWDTYYGYANHLPHDKFYGGTPDTLSLELERTDGTRYQVRLPYLDPDEVEWEGHSERRYPGFSEVPELAGFETIEAVYLPDDPAVEVILLRWLGFRGDLMEAMDALMDFAEERGILDHHVILDATRGRGGSRGSYALQRLQPEPHRGTFGNLMVSDLMEAWVEDHIAGIREGRIQPSSVDDGTWLLEWLEIDARYAIEAGNRYTNDVPFKGAHGPKWSDGIIDPAPVHFRGGLTVWLAPHGGSHLDQFAAQVVDNDVGHVMGMPVGGYSNTWSSSEVLRFPTTGRPIVEFEWSMGHSIRPNGEILQYNPAQPHEHLPQTRDNYFDYHADLLRRTLERLESGSVAASEGAGS